MTDPTTTTTLLTFAFLGCCFAAAATAGMGAARLALDAGEGHRVRQRLRLHGGDDDGLTTAAPSAALRERASELGKRLLAAFGGGGEQGGDRRLDLRRKLVRAGVYAADAPRNFAAARFALLALGLLVGWPLAAAMGQDGFAVTAAAGAVGFMLPPLWLRLKVKGNHAALEKALPDGLDLMVVCVEAGLTVDAAMLRVGEELSLAHPALAREFGVTHMETQIGVPRGQALRNLGERTSFPPLQTLTSMLVQADRFGTSIATALRVQADSLREKRKHKAEEAAAKASVKLTFPLVLFIFPASFLVMAGPMVLRLMHSSALN